ncbi:hypothetical protein DdX_12748 [Ditylenchus destructor]|uniref:Uncharacterized protein n=1 Tax=Ditylenchus destructor TaxID=166010 RepID=A0AAD4MV53_9BILA|nr:hypothetical protein DdX_12748 [Ditylenchus destructor]
MHDYSIWPAFPRDSPQAGAYPGVPSIRSPRPSSLRWAIHLLKYLQLSPSFWHLKSIGINGLVGSGGRALPGLSKERCIVWGTLDTLGKLLVLRLVGWVITSNNKK